MTDNSLKKPITPEDAFRLNALQDALFSPDGRFIVYGVFETSVEKEKDFTNLWLIETDSGKCIQLTYGDAKNYSPAWSPDSRSIAFVSNRSGLPQLYKLPIDGGEAVQLTDLKQGVGGGPVFSPDGTMIAFSAGPAEKFDDKKPYRVNRHVYRFDGMGYLDGVVQDIYVLNIKSSEVKALTDDRFNNAAPLWSPDGKKILYQASMDPDSFNIFSRLRVVDLDGGMDELVGAEYDVEGAAWHPDGKRILFVGIPMDRTIGENNDLYILDPESRQVECRTTLLNFSISGALRCDFPISWRAMRGPLILPSKDGQSIYTTVHDGGTLQIYQITLSGAESCKPLSSSRTQSTVLMDCSDQHMLWAVANFNDPGNLHLLELSGKTLRQLTDLNHAAFETMTLGTVKPFTYTNEAGNEIEGWVMLPTTGKPPYPTVLYIHGGPHSAYGNLFSFDYHMLSGAGYAVLFTNPRGSGGYGNDFATSILGNWGDLVFNDLMKAVDLMVKDGLTDPERLACYGLSYGGYMVTWIVGHTKRFKAGISENPVTNLISMYGTSDIGAFFNEQEIGGLPHVITQKYLEQSPIMYAHNCVTPTLMIQGEADYRCPAEQTEQFYTILKANGCKTEMLRLPASPHSGSISGSYFPRKAANEAFLEWVNTYVKGG